MPVSSRAESPTSSQEPPKPASPPSDSSLPSSDNNTDTVNASDPNEDEWQELMGPDLVMKTLRKSSVSNPVAVKPGDAVRIHFTGRVATNRYDTTGPLFQSTYSNDPPNTTSATDDEFRNDNTTAWLIVIGEKDVLPAVELGVRFGHVGETLLVWSHSKYAYGPSTRKLTTTASSSKKLSPHASVVYEITIVSTEPVNTASPLQQLDIGHSKKRIGNDIYANDGPDDWSSSRALQQYQRAVELVQHLLITTTSSDDKDEDVVAQARQLLVDCYNNQAALHLRHQRYKKAKEASVQALERDPDNFKALIRAAKASLLDPASEWEEVQAALEAAAERAQHDNNQSRDLQVLQAEFLKRKRAYQQKSKAMFASKLNNTTSTTENETEAVDDAAVMISTDNTPPTVATQDSDGASTAADTASAESTQPSNQDNDTSEQVVTGWRSWDWKNKIIPYGFQLLMPFLMYWYFTVLKKRQQEEEGTQMPGSSARERYIDSEF